MKIRFPYTLKEDRIKNTMNDFLIFAFKARLSPLILLCCLLAQQPLFAEPDESLEQFNILILAVDDLNDWVTFLDGHADAKTPNMDRLTKRGTYFTNAHCQAPICNPSRTSIMYGLRPSTTGVYMNSPLPTKVPELARQITLPRHFAAQGYKTLACGKIYHASMLPEGDFDVEGPRHGQRIKLDRRHYLLPKPTHPFWDFGPQDYAEDRFIDHIDATWTIEQLNAKHDKPFLMATGFYRPHAPFYSPTRVHSSVPEHPALPPTKTEDRDDLSPPAIALASAGPQHDWFEKKQRRVELVRGYLACVQWTDEQVGRVLDALDASEYSENTIVVLFSDHGFHLGEKDHYAKQTLWERSTHVPLVISVPGMPSGQRCTRPVELLSIYPTLIDACGLEVRDSLDGVSLLKLLKDKDATWDHVATTTLGKDNHAIRDDDFRYIRYADGSEELYEHATDPNEWDNIANDPRFSSVKKRLAVHLPDLNRVDRRKDVRPRTAPRAKSRSAGPKPAK